MIPRADVTTAAPDLFKAWYAFSMQVGECGLEKSLLELVKIRASQINGCANCLNMHTADARPNVVILFTEDGRAELSALEERRGYLFSPVPPHERRELLAEKGPVRVWTTTETKLLNGMPAPKRENLTDIPVARMHAAHSKIYLATREDISFVVVAFDREGVRGKTLVQLADYATMRALARTVPAEGDQAMGTILGLFDETALPPEEMTAFDRAYLASLYDGMPNLPGGAKVLGVNRQLRQQAAEEDARP